MFGWAYSFRARYRSALVTFSPILLLFLLVLFFPPDGRERAQWAQFIGRFHPLAVHLPIALVLLVPVLEVAGRWERFSHLRLSSHFILALATIAAAFAAFLGWFLARSAGYSGTLITQHMWGGVSLAAICWLCWLLRGRAVGRGEKVYAAVLAVGVLVVSWTGYRGGQVSQGEDHLTEYMPSLLRHVLGVSDREPLLEAAAGSFYELRVQPIFAERCVSCHGPKKQKSKLRLDGFGWLMRGGKHGAVVKSGDAQASDLFRRISLAPDHDDFMPKETRQPLSRDQLRVIELWISAGASGTLPLDAIKGLPAGGSVTASTAEVSFPPIDAAAVAKSRQGIASTVSQLQDRFPNILTYESRDSAELVLNASLLGVKFGDADLQAFAPVAEHLVVADFSRTAITDRAASAIAAMKHLHVLRLAETKITDQTLRALSSLDQLQSLNVYGTGVTAAAFPVLEKFTKLEHCYIGRSAIQRGVPVPHSLTGKLVL